MRPTILVPLFSSLERFKGVAHKTLNSFDKLCGTRVIDLLFHIPVAVVDRRSMPAISEMKKGEIITAIVQVEKHESPPNARNNFKNSSPYKVICYNKTGFLTLVFFKANNDYINNMLPIGRECVISGKVDSFAGMVQIVHPDYIVPLDKLDSVKKLEPVYGLTAGISNKLIQKLNQQVIALVPDIEEWIHPDILKTNQFLNFKESITRLHTPTLPLDIDLNSPYRQRLAYDEFLAQQLALKIVRKHNRTMFGIEKSFSGQLKQQLLSNLPFALTKGQLSVIDEIETDLRSNLRMVRLLQGDVGSGKTIVALITMLNVIEAGYQAIIMAPTEILARQHYSSITKLVEKLGLKLALLTGSLKAKDKKTVIEEIKNGNANIIIGTHALFQEDIVIHNPGLVVIDEQHRFGVSQRLSLMNKGKKLDTLLMSATPIPRTLTQIIYGDMECSFLLEKPQNRKPIKTSVLSVHKEKQLLDGLSRALKQGEKIYWICPLIENSENLNLAAVETRFKTLQKIFGDKVALIHGRMKTTEREEKMADFKNGKYRILVATTVIEVGVDVPDATIIVIEHAERFGLAQLHQLRGRVGRGDKDSSCVLLYENLSSTAKQRLDIMRKSNDGFKLAEEDLKIRGGGDILGIKQSGLPEFKFASLSDHYDLLKDAAKDADLFLNKDPDLKSSRGEALRILLYLFEYDVQIRYLKG